MWHVNKKENLYYCIFFPVDLYFIAVHSFYFILLWSIRIETTTTATIPFRQFNVVGGGGEDIERIVQKISNLEDQMLEMIDFSKNGRFKSISFHFQPLTTCLPPENFRGNFHEERTKVLQKNLNHEIICSSKLFCFIAQKIKIA
jgi:hypothetical protein